MAGKAISDWRRNLRFWLLIAFLLLVFMTGGASRGDTVSLIVLRPVAVLACGAALWSLTKEQVRANAFPLTMAGAILLLAASHLLPLPPAIWTALPGRDIVAEIDKAAGLGNVWRPFSMSPSGAWNAFYSLFVPLAVLLLGVQLTRDQLFRLLPWMAGLGLLSGLAGLIQVIGDPNGPLYLYRITNNGSAVGLLANRNHQAILLATLLPMLAVYASAPARSEEQVKLRTGGAAAAAILIVPLLLVTGSRAGLITGILGVFAAAWLYRRPAAPAQRKRKAARFDPAYAIAAFGVIALAGLTVITSRAEAFKRLATPDSTEELRFQIWPLIAEIGWKYFPGGSGSGSFVEIYQIAEPGALLGTAYVNHAHNDWLELFLTFGLPGIAILAVAATAYVRQLLTVLRRADGDRSSAFARLGGALIALIALASLADYPLRTPILSSLFVVAILWFRAGEPDRTAKGLEA